MELALAGNLKLETDLPILEVAKFRFNWKPGCHALLRMEGYLDAGASCRPEQFQTSHLKLWLEKDETKQTIYHGLISETEILYVGGTSHFTVETVSASSQLDRRPVSRSFQDTSKTYGEIVKQAVQSAGGEVIRNRETDKVTGCPVIQYEETVWGFANRQGNRLGVPIIPDIETGEPNLWFGMRKGKEVPALPETQCSIRLHTIGKNRGILLTAEGREFYKIGDQMTYLAQKKVIVGVEGRYENGELIFTYTLKDADKKEYCPEYASHPAGLGLWGTVSEVKEERISLALDLDGGENTGEYFYPWYPDTGNGIYAMPEKGSKVLLYFFEADEREGAVIHCMNQKPAHGCDYKDRAFNLTDGNSILLESGTIDISRDRKHKITLTDHSVFVKTSGELNIRAEGKIRFKGKQIKISLSDELRLLQE